MKHCLRYPIIEYDTSAAHTITRKKSEKQQLLVNKKELRIQSSSSYWVVAAISN